MDVHYLYDPVRAKRVLATPEEKIRQGLILKMIGPLGYPRGLLAVEKDLRSLVPFCKWEDPHRRIDLLCFCPGKEGLRPLLLIECKADAGNEKLAQSQVFGYNQQIRAPFLAFAGPEGVRTIWFEKEQRSVPFLPPFSQLVQAFS